MKGFIYIENQQIGEANFKIIDESMGAIGGELLPNLNYENYRRKIQNLWEVKGIANITDFNFKIILANNVSIDHPAGGIGITDMAEGEEKYVEAAGVDGHIIEMIKLAK